jgi:hypothetical protein
MERSDKIALRVRVLRVLGRSEADIKVVTPQSWNGFYQRLDKRKLATVLQRKDDDAVLGLTKHSLAEQSHTMLLDLGVCTFSRYCVP